MLNRGPPLKIDQSTKDLSSFSSYHTAHDSPPSSQSADNSHMNMSKSASSDARTTDGQGHPANRPFPTPVDNPSAQASQVPRLPNKSSIENLLATLDGLNSQLQDLSLMTFPPPQFPQADRSSRTFVARALPHPLGSPSTESLGTHSPTLRAPSVVASRRDDRTPSFSFGESRRTSHYHHQPLKQQRVGCWGWFKHFFGIASPPLDPR
jgi:hypothetical protein